MARGIDIGANQLKVSWGETIWNYSGGTRNGFQTRVVTRAEDMGDTRLPKLWGDMWLDCTPFDASVIYCESPPFIGRT